MIEQHKSARFYSGLSGIVLPIPKYKFPEEFQQLSRLTYYASQLNSIEVNRSFYTLPNPKTVAKWSREVPENFRFTFKLWKQITHAKALQFDPAQVQQFMDAIDNVGDKKGALLIQFPASLKSYHADELRHLLEIIQTNNSDGRWKLAIEFRDTSWYSESIYDLMDTYSATVVIHDKSKAATPHLAISPSTVYVRFHGPKGDYRGSYDDSFLHEYAAYVREWLSEGKSVFVYFNNTMGDAFRNLNTLRSALQTTLHGRQDH